MNHAIEVLEERETMLKRLIRQCQENGDFAMQGIPTDKYEQHLGDIRDALEALDRVPLLHHPE